MLEAPRQVVAREPGTVANDVKTALISASLFDSLNVSLSAPARMTTSTTVVQSPKYSLTVHFSHPSSSYFQSKYFLTTDAASSLVLSLSSLSSWEPVCSLTPRETAESSAQVNSPALSSCSPLASLLQGLVLYCTPKVLPTQQLGLRGRSYSW